MRISYISSLGTGEIRTMDTKSENTDILTSNETDDIVY